MGKVDLYSMAWQEQRRNKDGTSKSACESGHLHLSSFAELLSSASFFSLGFGLLAFLLRFSHRDVVGAVVLLKTPLGTIRVFSLLPK